MAKMKLKYGWLWPENMHPLAIEHAMVERGGQWENSKGDKVGEGLDAHFTYAIKLTWPFIVFHRWLNTFIEEYLHHRLVGAIGPASSGKSFNAAVCGLKDYQIFPSCTTGLYCSTTREMLQQRIWGEVVSLHNYSVRAIPWMPGILIESRLRIVTTPLDDAEEARNVKNGLLGVAAKRGESFIGLGDFVGVKNKRVRLYGDELSLLPKVFVDAIANLDKNDDFKACPLGNPKETTDALGIICEPSAAMGGWDGGIDQDPTSKVWDTKWPGGRCIQYVGSDSPNLDGKLGIPLITQEAIDRDVEFFGKDSLQFTMMDQGMMPRGQGSKRVLTRQLIEQHGAKLAPMWLYPHRIKGASLDAAYGGVGGDRTILKFWEFGEEINSESGSGPTMMSALVSQPESPDDKRQIFAITETLIVPVTSKIKDDPCDQIVTFTKAECEKRGVDPKNFFFESGMRAALVQAFMRKWSEHVNAIDCGGGPTDRPVSHDIEIPANKYYKKLISELWYAVRWVVLSNQFRGMTNGEIEEFCAREWGMVGANLTEVESKKDMKKKIGRSPDEADTVVVAVEGARRLGFVIKKLRPLREPDTDERWKRQLKEKSRQYWKQGQLSAA